MVPEVTVRRASRDDLDVIAGIIRRSSGGRVVLDRTALLHRLFEWGYWVSATSKVMGVVGWQAANFVACLRDFHVYPAVQRRRIGGPLLLHVEEEAKALSCEVAFLLVDRGSSWRAIKFFRELGFERANVPHLIKAWREVAEEHKLPGEVVLTKKLLEKRVMVPVQDRGEQAAMRQARGG